MAKEVKFTEKELQSLTDLQTKYNSVTNKFGQLAIAKLNIEKLQITNVTYELGNVQNICGEKNFFDAIELSLS